MTNQEILDAMHRAHVDADFEGKNHMLYPWSADAAISDVQELCRLFAREIQRLTREECAKVCDERADDCNHTWTVLVSKSCAKAIRAMKD